VSVRELERWLGRNPRGTAHDAHGFRNRSPLEKPCNQGAAQQSRDSDNSGSGDSRRSCRRASRFEELRPGLDWAAFSARRFPNGRRHDLEAIAAYFAYKRVPREAAGKNGAAEEIEAWEDEGGSIRLPFNEPPPGRALYARNDLGPDSSKTK
jgi:hypothetical protein